MRQIKLRGWVQSEKLMIGHRETIERAILQFDYDLGGYDDIVMQFTGLYDKNRNEIYEGDIVQYGDVTTEVRFLNGSFDLQSPSGIDGGWIQWAFPTRAIMDWQGIEVIGNVYENPELRNI